MQKLEENCKGNSSGGGCISKSDIRVHTDEEFIQDAENALIDVNYGALSDIECNSEDEQEHELDGFQLGTLMDDDELDIHNEDEDGVENMMLQEITDNHETRIMSSAKSSKKVRQYSLVKLTTWKRLKKVTYPVSTPTSKGSFQMMADQTNVYSLSRTGTSINTMPDEIKYLFSIHVSMGILKYPQLRLH
nr:unnamed protein product [Callosobruchus analis]